MSRVVAIGETARVAGFVLAGCEVIPAATPDDLRTAWDRVTGDVGLVLLTPDAAATLRSQLAARPRLLWTVLP
jgi:vacuolar-type H+-ATPase subunit F/Vma7